MTDQQILFHANQLRASTRCNDEAVIDAVAERMLDDESSPDARDAARERVRSVLIADDFNMFGG